MCCGKQSYTYYLTMVVCVECYLAHSELNNTFFKSHHIECFNSLEIGVCNLSLRAQYGLL